MEVAALVGCRRRIESRANDRAYTDGWDGSNGWEIDIEGAAAEMAYAKFRGHYWSASVGSFCLDCPKGPDINDNVQIRSTKHKGGALIVREDDNADHYYVLLTGTAPRFTVRGYIQGIFAKNETYLTAPNGRPAAYFVPQSALNPFQTKGSQ